MRARVRRLVLTATVLPLLAGCGRGEADAEALGAAQIPLSATSSDGRSYVLCQGRFDIHSIEGSSRSWTIEASEHANEPLVTQALPPGSYSVTLGNWQLCQSVAGALLPVTAQLDSAFRVFVVVLNQVSYVSYDFTVGGQQLTLSPGGQVGIRINVREADAGDAGGQSDLNSACVASCTQEHQTAWYPSASADGGLASCSATIGSSCSTYCAYEVGWGGRGRGRGGSCPDKYLAFYLCAASTSWTCVQSSGGGFVATPPAGCSVPTTCY